VPTDNGTSSNTSITGRMEQYVGFYGNVSMQVRNNTAAGNVMYRKGVTSGRLYFLKASVSFPTELVNATANSTADTVIGVSGFYSTATQFDSRGNICSKTNVSKLTTEDSRTTGMLSNVDNSVYLFCTDLGSFTSTNGFGTINYEVIVASTASYASYDVWFDLS
jgi:hypothetical protein